MDLKLCLFLFSSIAVASCQQSKSNKTGVINYPLGQTHSLASSEHCFRLKFVLFHFEKWGRTDGHVRKQ